MRGKTEAANRFKLPRTAFFLIVSLEHPRLDARMFFQPFSQCFHRAPSPNYPARQVPQSSRQVRASYNRLRPLEKLQAEKRGWTLDVLQAVQSLGKLEFTLADAHTDALAKLHPQFHSVF